MPGGLARGAWIRRKDLLTGLAVAILLALLVAGSLHSTRHAATTVAPEASAGAVTGIAIDWPALRPPSERQHALPSGKVGHAWLMSQRLSGSPASTGSGRLVPDFDGRTVRLSGFAMPVGDDPAGASDRFLLVPYFGACVHVPPPPRNQMVLVQMAQPVRLPMFAQVEVVGPLQRLAGVTHQDRAGYVIMAQSALPQPTGQ